MLLTCYRKGERPDTILNLTLLLFCAKTIMKESHKFEVARLKKKKKKKKKKERKKNILAVW